MFNSIRQSDKNSKNKDASIYDFVIDSSNVITTKAHNLTSFTFRIERDSIFEDSFENLVLQKDSLGNSKAYIIKYHFKDGLVPITEHNTYAYNFEYEVYEISNSGKNGYSSKISADCPVLVVYETWCSWDYDHRAGSGCVDDGRLYERVSYVEGVCEGSGGDPDPGDGDTGGPGGGGGGGGNDEGDGIVTTPNVIPHTWALKNFTSGYLNSQERVYYNSNGNIKNNIDRYLIQKNFGTMAQFDARAALGLGRKLSLDYKEFNWGFNNGNGIFGKIFSYLSQHENSAQSKAFCKEAITTVKSGGQANFDEEVLFDLSLEDYPCHQKVISDALRVSSPVTQAVQAVFGKNEGVNLIFKTSNSIGENNAITKPRIVYNSVDHSCNVYITIKKSYLETATDISIARTAIHESLHALLLYVAEENLLYNDHGTPMEGFEGFLEGYVNYLAGLPPYLADTHHDLMSNLVDDMATSLSSFALFRGYSKPYSYYKKLCWSGKVALTSTFQDLYPAYLNPSDTTNNPTNLNPEYLDIINSNAAEQMNKPWIFEHPNGTTYEYLPVGSQPNSNEPCD